MGERAKYRALFSPFEQQARAMGYQVIAGIDEAGRGPLAGPVVAAAVLLPPQVIICGLQDSKRLTAKQRHDVFQRIRQQAISYGIGIVSHRQIDQKNILQATKEAMLLAIRRLQPQPDLLLIDGNQKLTVELAQQLIVGGDRSCASIAAASVVAKVVRDRLMIAYSQRYPVYDFAKHKGYPTAGHYIRLRTYGPCAIHRRSFRGVKEHVAVAQQGFS